MVETPTDQRLKAFRALHQGPTFVMPNPWDAGSARVFAALGFRALATTSSGFAFTLGRHDGATTLLEVLEHVRELANATPLPLSVDLENGHGVAPEDAAAAVRQAASCGAVGGSIEDWDAAQGIYPLELAVSRVEAAAEEVRRLSPGFVLTARAENLIRGVNDLDDTCARLQAYAAAGAEVVFAPGLRTYEDVRRVCDAVDVPVNVLARPDMTVDELAACGAQRISVGGSLTWAAIEAMVQVALEIRDTGSFAGLRSGERVAGWLEPPLPGVV
jgi:2-methylisocitrate lyase-like PEP mutase family enzyme